MLICYVDESGDTGALPNPTSPIQPLICILGLTLGSDELRDFTLDFLDLKHRFFPGLFTTTSRRLDRLLIEVKGSDLRAPFRQSDPRQQRHHLRLFLGLFGLLRRYNCRVFGRVWIKPIAPTFNGPAVYTSSAQSICSTFENLLETVGETGIVITDSRSQAGNTRVSFSVFTQQFSTAGNPYPRIPETLTFANSQNHAGLQACDWLCSGLVFPIAAYSYCSSYVTNLHVHPGYGVLKTRYGTPLRDLQHRYFDAAPPGRWRGGLVVSDPLARRHGGHLFT